MPQSHRGGILNHHHQGIFCGSVDPYAEGIDVDSAVSIAGSAGSASFHLVKALHGSGVNHSNPRKLLFFEYAAAGSWPLIDFEIYSSYEQFEQKMVLGKQYLVSPNCG